MENKESIETFAKDLTRILNQNSPTDFDKSWETLEEDEKYELLKIANKMIEKGWSRDVQTDVSTK